MSVTIKAAVGPLKHPSYPLPPSLPLLPIHLRPSCERTFEIKSCLLAKSPIIFIISLVKTAVYVRCLFEAVSADW